MTTTRTFTTTTLTLAALIVIGCSQADPPGQTGGGDPQAASLAADFLLTAEPAQAKGVADARKTAEDGDQVAVVGRVGGAEEPFVEGIAAFLITDEALKPCDDGCQIPWDYCCSPDLPSSKAMVKLVDDQSRTVETDARQLLGIKELQTVVVRGRAKRDDAGNLTLLADGVYIRR